MSTEQTIDVEETMTSINDVCDHIVVQCIDAGESLSALKLQKLAYYVQAWHLAFYGKRLFDDEFEAWVHGPVCRALYERFRETKSLYSDIQLSDVSDDFDPQNLLSGPKGHIDAVLEAYAKYSGSQLEALSHREDPWIEARGNCHPASRCETPISDSTMQRFYSARG